MVRRLEQNLGADAVRAATGRGYDEWCDLLDGAGATEWVHVEIARFLADSHDVPRWWAQGITVAFEQARKGRLPGQQADGTFATSVTRTIPGARLEALAAVAESVSATHGQPYAENLAAAHPVLRWRLPDGTRLAASAQPENAGGTPINLTRTKLSGAELVDAARQEALAVLAEVAAR